MRWPALWHLRHEKSSENSIKLKVCYDGRGALKAEAQEYNVYPDYLKPLLFESERNAVLNSDMRIAVSEELIAAMGKSPYGYDAETISSYQRPYPRCIKILILPYTVRNGEKNSVSKQMTLSWPLPEEKPTGKEWIFGRICMNGLATCPN